MSDRRGDDSDDEDAKTPQAGRPNDGTEDSWLRERDEPSVGEASRARGAVLSALFPEEARVLDGRYELGSMIGSGGLGRVYKALDTKLGRHVAVKFLKGGTRDPELAHALEGEARVLARLQHPNIVAVHDVGRSEDELYLTMELIDGESLESWLETPRSWQAVVDVMQEAALGLAAAHEAGVVHRDFKPANVMVDRTGRVRVVDFGLAREVVWTEDVLAPSEGGTLQTKAAGTPPYMAPEQFAGEVSAASDQFSFCTTLYEGLCGERPWKGRERGVGGESKRDPLLQRLRGTGLPVRSGAAVLRGLARRPQERFASMGDLVAGLDPPRSRRRSVWAAAAAAAAATVASVGGGWLASQPDVCARRGVAASAMVSEARDVLRRLEDDGAAEAAFEDATKAWNALDGETCEAHAAQRLSSTLYELRTRCLDRTLLVTESALGTVSDGEFPLNRARVAIAHAMRVDRCRDDEGLLLGAPEPGYDVEAGGRIQRAIDEAHVLMTLGEDDRWLSMLLEVQDSIDDRSAVLPDALWLAVQLGDALLRAGRLEDADAVLMPALLEAKAHPRWARTVATLQIQLAKLAQVREDYDRAELLLALAEPALRALPEQQFLLTSLVVRASVAQTVGRWEDALLYADRAEAMLDDSESGTPPWAGVAMLRADVESVRCAQSLPKARTEEALRACSRALDLLGAAGVERGRSLATVVNNQAVALVRAGRPREAVPLYERAAALKASAGLRVGAASTRMNLANQLDGMGRYDEAMNAYAEAETLLGRERGVLWAKLHLNRSVAHASKGKWQAAAVDARTALECVEGLEDISPEERYDYEVSLGVAEVACGRSAAGRDVLEQALRHERPRHDPYSKAELRIALAPHVGPGRGTQLRSEALVEAKRSGDAELVRKANELSEDRSRKTMRSSQTSDLAVSPKSPL